MTAVGAALAVLGAVSLLNLFLVLAIARRVREFGEHLVGQQSRAEQSPFLLPSGTLAPDFTTTSLDGSYVSRTALIGQPSLIAFLLADCAPCHKQVPALVQYAPTVAARANVLAVISGSGNGMDSLTNALEEVATVVIEEGERPLGDAFSVQAYPAFYQLDESGVIQSSGPTIPRLAAGVGGSRREIVAAVQ